MANLCHYCGGRAGTRDHIVPRCLLVRPHRPVLGVPNIVHACERCNQLKGWGQAMCKCDTCITAWETYYDSSRPYPARVIDVRTLALAEDAARVLSDERLVELRA